jgi:5-formyltetrahydrofolate cyclo-ligase
MPDRPPCKAQLREELRRQRRALGPHEQSAAARAAAFNFTRIPSWKKARRIALYLASDGEIDTSAVSANCRAAGKQLFLPVIGETNLMEFAEWTQGERLTANRYGIPEPPRTARRCAVEALDIIVLPLVGWDSTGGRLGMGGGFYDRALAGVKGPLLVGLAHTVQQLPRVPRDDWDVPLDFVVTGDALHPCQGHD